MRLINQLFKVTAERDEAAAKVYTIELNPAHFIYSLHFPGNPLTPGVCILQAAAELLELMTGSEVEPVKIVSVKYVNPISPDNVTLIDVAINAIPLPDEGQLRLKATLKDGDNKVLTRIDAVYRALLPPENQ